MLKVIKKDTPPDALLAALSSREVSLWLHHIPVNVESDELARFVALPWRDVFISEGNGHFLDDMIRADDPELVRRRGYMQLIRTDPTQLSLPPRSLPVYLLGASGC